MSDKPNAKAQRLPRRPKGPYVRAALICDQVIQGNDNINTIVRIIDRFTLQIDPSVSEPILGSSGKAILVLQTVLFISLTHLPEDQEHRISIILQREGSKKRVQIGETKVIGGGRLQGANLILNLGIGLDEAGMYLIDVICNDRVLTTLPVEVEIVVSPEEPPAEL